MMKKKYTALSLVTATAVAAIIGCMVGQATKTDDGPPAVAQGSPVKAGLLFLPLR